NRFGIVRLGAWEGAALSPESRKDRELGDFLGCDEFLDFKKYSILAVHTAIPTIEFSQEIQGFYV
ncbi:MAG: hypothetical protein HC767_04935, partial [Akkermansiaceae bacterium]|nr:hypothetical protein [Akkermansiaceae bacterium]